MSARPLEDEAPPGWENPPKKLTGPVDASEFVVKPPRKKSGKCY